MIPLSSSMSCLSPGLQTPASGLQTTPGRKTFCNPDPARDRPRPRFESGVPTPIEDVSPFLRRDDFIKDTLQDPEASLAFYDREVARRKTMEDEQQEYTFPPLMTTLYNMKLLTQNILDGKQFEEPLTAQDRAGFEVLAGYIQELTDRQAPYIRTVQLALMMTCMQEIVTARYVLAALCARYPTFSERLKATGMTGTHGFCSASADGSEKSIASEEASLDLVLSCHWGGLNPGGADENSQLFGNPNEHGGLLTEWLRDHRLFLHPSFEPLDPRDFCRFGHMPIYPLGMMTAYALNADGAMMSPLLFFNHDMGHAQNSHTWLCLKGHLALEAVHNRLHFRQLVLDSLPVALKAHKLEPALELIVFNLLHEFSVTAAREQLEAGSFLPLLHRLNTLRRQYMSNYPTDWQKVTDWQALLASFWAHRAYKTWCTAGTLANARDRLASRFVAEDMPSLLAHFTFLQTHHAALQDHFFSRSEVTEHPDGTRVVRYTSQSPWARFYFGSGTLLLVADNPDFHDQGDEGALDNTDTVYFDMLHDGHARGLMMQELRLTPPQQAL